VPSTVPSLISYAVNGGNLSWAGVVLGIAVISKKMHAQVGTLAGWFCLEVPTSLVRDRDRTYRFGEVDVRQS
jgi:hypothetical protein